jgi:hypothetical protein
VRVVWLSLLFACAPPSDTRLELAISSSAPVDHYEVSVGARSTLADPAAAVDVDLPDALAGQPQTVQVWGLDEREAVAYGTVTVAPILHQTVDAHVDLGALACGVCTVGETTCAGSGTQTCVMGSAGCPHWSAVTACPASAPACSNGTCGATCVDDCTTGQTECDTASSIRTCGEFDTDACLDWSPSMPCAHGQVCTNGACVTCPIDGTTCDDDDPCTVNDTCEAGACSGLPKCTSAPADATPTCGSDGTCGFACNHGFIGSGSGCIVDNNDTFTIDNEEAFQVDHIFFTSDLVQNVDLLAGIALQPGDSITVQAACTTTYTVEVQTPTELCQPATTFPCPGDLEIIIDNALLTACTPVAHSQSATPARRHGHDCHDIRDGSAGSMCT